MKILHLQSTGKGAQPRRLAPPPPTTSTWTSDSVPPPPPPPPGPSQTRRLNHCPSRHLDLDFCPNRKTSTSRSSPPAMPRPQSATSTGTAQKESRPPLLAPVTHQATKKPGQDKKDSGIPNTQGHCNWAGDHVLRATSWGWDNVLLLGHVLGLRHIRAQDVTQTQRRPGCSPANI